MADVISFDEECKKRHVLRYAEIVSRRAQARKLETLRAYINFVKGVIEIKERHKEQTSNVSGIVYLSLLAVLCAILVFVSIKPLYLF